MDKKLLVIFGLPGTGKSYVAEIFANKFGYFIYDGDSDIPQNMRDALCNKETITDDMRKEFIKAMISTVKKLSNTHKKLAVHQTFLKEFMRKQFFDEFPEAKFILIETPDSTREQRYMGRVYFNLGLPYLRHMSSLFDPVEIPHETITNKDEGKESITKQLTTLIASHSVE